MMFGGDAQKIYKRLIANIVTSLRLVIVGKQAKPIDSLFVEGKDGEKEGSQTDTDTETETDAVTDEGNEVSYNGTNDKAAEATISEVTGAVSKGVSSVSSKSESEKSDIPPPRKTRPRNQRREPSESETQTDTSDGSIPDFDGFGAL
eukprot:gnl/Chilomastix_caulleri/2083.p1 GENE.gnl/Chilomastix_caulleri/2083~~gnl/Chilomastix_caulleri/2083.p1  ORF type:complete len:147 (+),score=49.32 gnl/Chilomastix_caulleri/2083:137-577(+)